MIKSRSPNCTEDCGLDCLARSLALAATLGTVQKMIHEDKLPVELALLAVATMLTKTADGLLGENKPLHCLEGHDLYAYNDSNNMCASMFEQRMLVLSEVITDEQAAKNMKAILWQEEQVE